MSMIYHYYRLSASTLVLATYGHEIKSDDDQIYRLAREMAKKTEIGVPGATIPDLIPIRKSEFSHYIQKAFYDIYSVITSKISSFLGPRSKLPKGCY